VTETRGGWWAWGQGKSTPYSRRSGAGGVDYFDSEGMARDSGLGAVRVVDSEGGGGAGPRWRARVCTTVLRGGSESARRPCGGGAGGEVLVARRFT
jgi:hypothetical protein